MVRVVDVLGFSVELCGGTHVSATGEIGLFKIVSEAGIAAGTRRIEAITGVNSFNYVRELNKKIADTAAALKIHVDNLAERAVKIAEEIR